MCFQLILLRLIQTPDQTNKFGRSAGVRLNEVLLYIAISPIILGNTYITAANNIGEIFLCELSMRRECRVSFGI